MASERRAGERGVLVPAFALWLAVALVCGLLVVGVANRVVDRAAAQSAADAAALAGAASGRAEAAAFASANGADLVSFTRDGLTVTVRVVRNGVEAEARAEKQIRPRGPG
ncbi:MAG: TadE-like protein [Acidimicrobiales bacterium]|nr:TadE-like protein [Acidimicrobiales bacterium]